MISRLARLACSVVLLFPVARMFGQELNTILMQSTFKLEGPSKALPGSTSVGTVFIMGLPIKEKPGQSWYVMVTANHVLDGVAGEVAQIHLRRKGASGDFERLPWLIKIRDQAVPRWVKHKEADIAVAYIGLPTDLQIPLLTTDWLADDALLDKLEIHPGDDLECLGYPFGEESNSAGFPILRSGKIASYPLIPASRVKTFLFDFQVYGGNSGGPVYFSQDGGRSYGGSSHIGGRIQFLAGMVVQERQLTEVTRKILSDSVERHPLFLAVVVPAQFIRDTISMLPAQGPSLTSPGYLPGSPVASKEVLEVPSIQLKTADDGVPLHQPDLGSRPLGARQRNV